MPPTAQTSTTPFDRIVREPERRLITGVSRSQWHRMVAAGKAPAPVKISDRASGTRLSDLQTWMASLAPASGDRA